MSAATSKPPPVRILLAEQPLASSGSLRSPQQSSDGSQPPKNIFEAAERGMMGYIVRQVERNIEYNINQKDKLERTALHWAAECNQLDVAECLIDYGCKVTSPECNGRTAVHLAARNGHVEMLKLLCETLSPQELQFAVNAPDLHGLTPVFLALQKGDETRAAFNFLMENGGNYNSTGHHQPMPSTPQG